MFLLLYSCNVVSALCVFQNVGFEAAQRNSSPLTTPWTVGGLADQGQGPTFKQPLVPKPAAGTSLPPSPGLSMPVSPSGASASASSSPSAAMTRVKPSPTGGSPAALSPVAAEVVGGDSSPR